jgi:hypothetical protein
MKRMITILALCSACSAYGQYRTAIGLRLGETSGITLKRAVANAAMVEGIIGIWNRGLSATILYEIYASAFSATGLNWYYGGGGHLAVVTYQRGYRWYDYGQRRFYYDDGGMGIGIDGVIGLEYKFQKAPVAFSLDLKPFLEFNTRGGAWVALDPGLGVKVAF